MTVTPTAPRPRKTPAAATVPKAKTARQRRALPVGEDRRAHILAAAQRIFESKGLEGANMRAIAKEAHYTVGALYFYYKSREEIYADLLTTSLWRLKDFTQAAAEEARTPGEQLQTRAVAFYDYYATRPDEMSLGFYLFRGLGPHGLTHTLDERLNAQFWMTLIGVLDPLAALGRTQAEAVRELTAIVAHGVGLLLLVHTGRIRLFHQDGRELFRAFVEASVTKKGEPMPESLHTRFLRWKFNWFPPYRGSGARITYIDETLREVRLRLPLNRRTRNLNGTIYGGSIYSAVDPIHAVMLAQVLGPRDYVAWTKEARIRFRRQGRTALSARFVLEQAEVEEVLAELAGAGKVERWYPVELFDEGGHLCANCDILVHVHTRLPLSEQKNVANLETNR